MLRKVSLQPSSSKERLTVEDEPHVRLLSMLWFPLRKAQQSRRRKRAMLSWVSIGSICTGSRTCLRALVSTTPRSSSKSPHLQPCSLGRRRTVKADNGWVRGQLCKGRRSQSLVNFKCIWGKSGGAIERTEVFEARHLDLIARGTSCERRLDDCSCVV